MSRSRTLGWLIVAAGLATVAACSDATTSDSGKTQDVATIVGTSAAPPGTPASAVAEEAERPLIRTDTSEEEQLRLLSIFYGCLEQQGVPMFTGPKSTFKKPMPDSREQYEKALKVCQSKEPETVWLRAQRLDPNYPEKLHAWAKCLQDKGVKVKVNEADGFLSYDDGKDMASKEDDEACQNKVFGRG